jgi:hypothetical protein
MSATKTWNIGDVLTASDLNSNFTKLPYSVASFTATYTSGAIAINTGTTVAIALPSARFSVAPICTVSTNSTVLTAYISAVNSGTVTVGIYNNGNASSAATVVIYGVAVQATSSTAAG